MRRYFAYLVIVASATFINFDCLYGQPSDISEIYIKWSGLKPEGSVAVLNGKLNKITATLGKCRISGNCFRFLSESNNSLQVSLSDVNINSGPNSTLITINNGTSSFSFFLRDVNKDYPVYIPAYHVIVSPVDDQSSYADIEKSITGKNLETKLQGIMGGPEESFNSASMFTRYQICPTWMGISRDMRIFQVEQFREMDMISPKNASESVNLPDLNNTPAEYCYMAGRGVGVEQNVKRRLHNGFLPILHSDLTDDDIVYESATFVAPEFGFTSGTNMGTHYLVADHFSAGHMFTENQLEILTPLLHEEETRQESTVLYYRCKAVNKSSVPRYAWFKTVRPGAGWWEKYAYTYNNTSGFSHFSSDRIFGISRLNGKPMPGEEIALLVKPGDTAVFEFILPHSPVSLSRAIKLAERDPEEVLSECQSFWNNKIRRAAEIRLPEKRIEEMLLAGLLHLDLITYGRDPDGTLAPCIGIYSPIGTESAPIIQFYNSMGLSDIARRSLMYFIDKQHDDGMIQNFGGYMVETGAVLWSMGEYYRYTHDREWINRVKPNLIKACEFLINWRQRNMIDSLKGKSFGLIDGKVADPEDPYHQFMLNGYAYLGLSRAAEMLAEIDPVQSQKMQSVALAWKHDIRTAFLRSMAGSPVIPMGNGTWCPTAPPWTEAVSPRLLYYTDETYVSHGTFTVPDALLGPMYLVFCEIFDAGEPVSKMILDYHTELLYQRNTAFSQPYYSRHDWILLKLGLVKPFLKTYYSAVSALADRETYTFWEHLYHASVHKTHEEAWFLMATRWMLYMEEGNKLRLLPGIPRKWMEDGKSIILNNVMSYFGPLILKVESHISEGYIEATLECNSDRLPEVIEFRLPHPDAKPPERVTGGVYETSSESVIVKPFTGKVSIRLEYENQ